MKTFLNTKYKEGEENMKLLGAMGNAIGGMVQGITAISDGRVAIFSDDGKEIIGYNKIGDILKDENKQKELVKNLSGLLGIYISAVTSSDIIDAGKGDTWFTDSKMTTAEGVFKKLNESIVPAINTIIENIGKLNSDKAFKSIDETTIKTKLSTILSGYVNSIAELDTSKIDDTKFSTFEKIQKVIDKLHKPIDDKNI
jgi:hypothetical protein